MKAIQIKFMGATDTKGSRLKAWTEAGSHIEALDYSLRIEEQAYKLAQRYIDLSGWGMEVEISGFGTLPNGDFVATLQGFTA